MKEIAGHFGISESGVSKSSSRVSGKIKKEQKLRKQIEKIEKKLNLSKVKS